MSKRSLPWEPPHTHLWTVSDMGGVYPCACGKPPPRSMVERRCSFCLGPHQVTDEVAAESPFCAACLHARVKERSKRAAYTPDVAESPQVRAIVAEAIAAERKRLAADIRVAIAKRETWTSGPEALELLAQELERETERTGA